jgi:hypothetical protein
MQQAAASPPRLAGFMVYASVAIVGGTFYDSDDGPIDQATQAAAFWLSVISMTLLGLFILGVGHRWEIVRMIFELAGRRFVKRAEEGSASAG